MKPGVLYRYKKLLPVTDKTPLFTLGEGDTPLVRAPALEKELDIGELYFKLEGCNPTGSFKDRGMVVAVAKALEEGSQALMCASTGNTSASAAAYAAARGVDCIIIVPKGKIALGKMAQAIVYRAKIVAIDGNFDQALTIVRALTDKHPIALVNSLNPNRILRVLGREAAQVYLLEEVQKVYRSQGVPINDKHIEVIIRQMTNKIQIVTSGDSDYLAGELLDNQKFQLINQNLMAEDKRPASGRPVLLGITKAALSTESFLSASSFQHTINVLAQAAIEGKRDDLFGLKENVILGKLIPAGSGYLHYYPERVADEQTNGEDGQEPSAENGSESASADAESASADAESASAESASAESGEELPDVTVSTDGDGTGEVAVNV